MTMHVSLCGSTILTLLLAVLAKCCPQDSPTQGRPFLGDCVWAGPGWGQLWAFCSIEGESTQTKSHCLTNVRGLCQPHPPPQHMISFSQLLGLLPYSLLGNPQCDKGSNHQCNSVDLISFYSSCYDNTIALLSFAQWFYEQAGYQDRTFSLYSLSPFTSLCPSPTLILHIFSE